MLLRIVEKLKKRGEIGCVQMEIIEIPKFIGKT